MLELLKIKKDINWLIDQVRCLMRKSDLTAPLSALEWSTNHSVGLGNPYMKDSFVWLEGYVYKSRVDNNEYPPTNASYWDNLGEGHLLIAEQSDWEATSGNAFIRNKPFIMEEAPDNGSQYVRKNEAWNKLTTYSSFNPIITDNVAAGYPLASDWYNTVTGEKFYQKANGVWISYTSFTPPVDGGDSPVVFADYATTTDLLIPYDNGMGGLGATLTSPTNGVLIVDGFTVELGESVLVKDQPVFVPIEETNISYQNGVYILTQAGSISEPFILTRADFADETEELYPSQVNILKGLTNKDRFFLQKTEDPVIGTSDIIYEINYVPPTQVVLLPVIHVDTATTEPLPTCTQETLYLTGVSNGNLGTINGVDMTIALTSVANRKILVKDQVDASQNGDYEVIQIGGPSQPWKLRRITTTSGGFNKNNREWKVNNEDSTLYGNRYYMNNVTYLFIVGTTDITFSELLAAIPSSLQDVTDVGNTTDNDIQFGTGAGVYMSNGSRLKEGTIDAEYGGSKGIAQICAVGYELKWEAGRLYVMGDGGTTIREVSHNFNYVPSIYDDANGGFVVGSRWILDNGDLYICTDNTIVNAVWELQVIGNQDLQNVTDVGSTTTNAITAFAFGVKPSYTSSIVANLGYTGDGTNAAGQLYLRSLSTGTGYWGIIQPGPLTDIRSYVLPDQSGTIALLSDIPSATLIANVFDTNHTTSTGNPYLIGDVVWYLGHIFRCLATNDAITPAIGGNVYWEDLGTGYLTRQNVIDWNATTGDTQVINKPSIDSAPTDASSNAVSSNGVFDALALKADLVAGKVPSSQLPSYVDDVLDGYYNLGVFYLDSGFTAPMTGEVGKIYVDLLENKSYRWSGSVYIQISNPISSINELTDVTVSSPLNGQLLQYNTTTSQWENQSITVGTGDMHKSTYDIDNDGIVDFAETVPVTVRNPSVSDILRKGTIVYLNGSTGYRPNAYKAQANAEATSSGTFGVVLSDIGTNSDGTIATLGTVHTLDTRNAATGAPYPFTNDILLDGDVLWLDPANAGYVTKTKPQAPNHAVFIGVVARTHPSLGRIVYRITNGYELDELHNVLINPSTIANNDVLYYDSATSLWKHKQIGGSSTPLTRQEFTYSGSQTFTLSASPSYTYGVFVNGQELNSTQYSITTNVLTILNTLQIVGGIPDSVNIVYGETAPGILDYYTKAQVDTLIANVTPDINTINATNITLMYNT